MEPDEPLSAPVIKRRNLKGVRSSSSSSSSLGSWRDAPVSDPRRPDQAGSTLTVVPANTTQAKEAVGGSILDDGEEPAVVFRRTKNKKTPRGAGWAAASTRPPIKSSLGIALSIADDDEEADSFVLTKRTPSSSSSHTPARKLLSVPDPHTTTQAVLPSNLDQATLSPQKPSLSPVYSSEYLQQLKNATLSTPPPPPASTEHDDLTRSKFASRFATQDDLHPESLSIPTTAAIASAKARRERLRTQPPTSDFISLQLTSSNSTNTGSQSRLVREDDDVDDDGIDHRADFEASLPLGKKATIVKKKEEKEGMMRLIDEAEEEMEEEADDDEVREWEERQLARVNESRVANEHTSNRPTYVPTPIPQTSTLPTLSNVQARLSVGLNTLESSRTLDVAALHHFEKERNELDTQEGELRSEAIRIEQKNRWFNDFKNFIEDVAAFLDEKFPALEKIEKENLAIQKERYEIVSRRRFEDDSDDVALFTGASVPSAFSLDPKTSPEDEEDKDGEEEEEEVDEMGRSTRRTEDRFGPRSGARVARRSARERRLENRKTLHQPSGIASTAEEDSAMWTDDDLISADSADLADALTSLQDLRKALFEDVRVDDFRDPNLGIRKKFEEWRSTYREDYENAFGGLALVGVWEFWARVEMALWNPFGIDQLARTPSGLDSYHWHSSLTAFGHASHPTNAEADDDSHMDEDDPPPDESAEVVNALVTSVVIPRLIALAKASYDPWSKKQTMKALALVDEVSYCVETTSPKFQSLVQAFLTRLQLGITQASTLILPHLNQLSLPSKAFDPSTFLARERFLLRQLKLLQNAHKWRRYARNYRLPLSTVPSTTTMTTSSFNEIGSGASFDELLQRDLVSKVMLPVIEASWSTGGQNVAGKVLMVFQEGDWIPALKRRLEGGGE